MADLGFFADLKHLPFQMGEGEAGILLIHGFPGTPADMLALGKVLAEQGYATYAPLMPGFGREIVRLRHYRRHHWLNAMRDAWLKVQREHPRRVLVGYSMGGAIALQLALEHPPDQLVLIAPFWRLRSWLVHLLPVARVLLPHIPAFYRLDFQQPAIRAQIRKLAPGLDLDDPQVQMQIRTLTVPTAALQDVVILGRNGYRLAPQIHVPALVLQGLQDHLVHPDDTRQLAARLGGVVQFHTMRGEHELLQAHAHSRAEVASRVIEFLAHPPQSSR